MKQWLAVPNNLEGGYFDMQFVEQAEQLVRGE